MQSSKRAILAFLLLLCISLWGTLAVAHQHLDIDQAHCEICALPHVGTVSPHFIFPVVTPDAVYLAGAAKITLLSKAILPYQSRAPPL